MPLPLLALLLSTASLAQDPGGAPTLQTGTEAPDADEAPDPEPPKPDAKPKTEFSASGLYTAWGLTQQNFLLGADHPLDDTAYTVQMIRANLGVKRGRAGVTTRFDAAQGWWGVNNDPNTTVEPSTDEDGAVTGSTAYNSDKLFGDKETNYVLHVDIAYAWAELDVGSMPLRIQIGRQFWGVGNGLVLDQDYDGIQLSLKPGDDLALDASWAKVSEGRGSFTLPTGTLMSDQDDHSDANLFGLGAKLAKEDWKGEVYALGYLDTIADDYTHLPQGLGYARARFTPQISRLLIVGAAADGTLPVLAGLLVKAEADVLVGQDLVANTDHQGGLLDINDGRLSGWTGYVDLTQKLDAPLDLGAAFGIGSGDADPTSGRGNVTKLQTMGFFPFTNVWEDSVMPDVEGISPQGLGSPVSRGYREFENTLALQGRVGFEPWKPIRLQASYSWFRAVQPVRAWDATGPGDAAASDLGMEVDADLIVKFSNGLQSQTLFGVFLPGTAAGYLINGTASSLVPAWEIKQVATVRF